VGDQDHAHLPLPRQLLDQVEDLRLDRHVERRRGLVGDDDVRLRTQRQRDHHALPHAAGELVRILVARCAHPGSGMPTRRIRSTARLRASASPTRQMRLDRLHQLLLHGEKRVQRGQRVLEDHADLLAAQLPIAASSRPEISLAPATG
jgi:hypothetical protein